MFLIEGHTDAVGSDVDNLSLSDRRAESVAMVLSQQFGVPAENLTTQGYGEQFLKVQTQAPEQQNRRVTVRRISPLLTGQNESYRSGELKQAQISPSRSSHSRSRRTLRRLARNSTSSTSPASGTAPTTPSKRHVGDHAREEMPRRAEPVGFVDQIGRECGGDRVADAGNQPDDGVGAEPDVGAGDDAARCRAGC